MKTDPLKMEEPKPILCGTDFSKNAAQAATVAGVLASRSGCLLLLVHVAHPLDGSGLDEEVRAARFRPLAKRLRAEADRLVDAGATVETKLVAEESAEQAIEDLGSNCGASLVVVSSETKSFFERWTAGSVSERLAQADPVPTLVVRSAAPFEAWAREERPLKVLVGTDFSASSDAALRWVAELRRLGPCEVVAAYVVWPPEEAAQLGISGSLKLLENSPEMQCMIEKDLQEKVAGVLGEEDVRVRVCDSWGRADVPLVKMAMEEKSDLVVLGTHQWRGLGRFRHGSVSRDILREAPMSVACIPTPIAAPVPGPRMRECKRVLVAVDLGEFYGFVAPYAYSIVQPGGTVRLMHNVMPFRLPNPMIGGAYREFPTKEEHAQIIVEAEKRFRPLAPPEAQARGITTEVEVTESRETAQAICAAAERFGADVICIGSHTRPGFTAKILGSVSLAVLQNSRRPVLVVWPPAK